MLCPVANKTEDSITDISTMIAYFCQRHMSFRNSLSIFIALVHVFLI